MSSFNTYMTTEIAHIIGIHPNTVRLYEKLNLIPKPQRRANGYRIFTDFHVEQCKLIRIALKVEVLQNGLRKKALDIIKTSATGNFDQAIHLVEQYLQQLKTEQDHAEEAITIVTHILEGHTEAGEMLLFTRKEAADFLQVTMDTLRNWEMNGLLTVKRKQNGYRVYTEEDMKRLKVIRVLRCANYSLAAILRMLNALSCQPGIDIRRIMNTPKEDDNIISVCDKLITSLQAAENHARVLRTQLEMMKIRFS